MRIYKVELFIIDPDHDDTSLLKATLEDTKYPNYCINPHVTSIGVVELDEETFDSIPSFKELGNLDYTTDEFYS